jgi:hypothetical protein
LNPGGSGGRVYIDRPHGRQIDYYAIVAEGATADVVASTADCRDLIVLACEIDRSDHVGGTRAASDESRMLLDACVPYPASVIVAGISRFEDLTMERGS